MRIENIRNLKCHDCGSDTDLRECCVSGERMDDLYLILCTDCYLDRDEEIWEMDNTIEKEGDY